MPTRLVGARLKAGATWKSLLFTFALHLIDPADYVVRVLKGHRKIPPFSVRARSIGAQRNFGGSRFVEGGRQIAAMLQKYAALTPDSRVLEIGCGCGRTAIALADILKDRKYTGMDIERVALESAAKNPLLRRKRFDLELLDVKNGLYNPSGAYSADQYVFPYLDHTFDVVFMTSVLTHLLTDEVRNYASQITRILQPEGRCYLTAFLLDKEMRRQFPYKAQEHSFTNPQCPESAVAYHSEFLTSTFAAAGMSLVAGPLWGMVHGGNCSETGDRQDVMVFARAR